LVPDEDKDTDPDDLYDVERTVYECENCGRLWIQAMPHTNTWVSYLPESATRGILRHGGVAIDE
jgi:hypothetical protein